MLTLTNRIDMRPGAVPLVVHLGQYDSDFSLVFELYSSAGNFTVESSTTAMIRGTKTDGHAYDADATIDVSAKTVTVAGSEQMTAAKGRNVYELVLTKSGKVLSTANFILDVERAAMDADTIASESVLKELNAIIAGAATATEAAADAASAADRAEDAADSVSSASTQIATNASDIADLKADFEQLEPFTEELKQVLLSCFRGVAWVDWSGDGESRYNALYNALYPDTGLVRIEAVFTQGGTVIYATTPLIDLKAYLTVTGYYNDGTHKTITDYALSGALEVGTSVITVTSGGKSTTFTVVVSAPYWDYEWYASSNTPPEEMVLESYDFTTDPTAMRAISPRLDFDYIGAAELEVTIRPLLLLYDESTGQYVEYNYSQTHSSYNNPQLALMYSNSGGTKTGARVIFASYMNNVMCTRLLAGGDKVDIFNDDYHSFRIVVESDTAKIYVDDVLTEDGQVFSSKYYEYSGITCVVNSMAEHPTKYGAYIKSIKFKRL